MVTPELIAYIQQESSLGLSPGEITAKLKTSGWNDQDIREAIATALHPKTPDHVSKPSPLQSVTHEFNILFTQAFNEWKIRKKVYISIQIIQILMIILSLLVGSGLVGIFQITTGIQFSQDPSFVDTLNLSAIAVLILILAIYIICTSILELTPYLMLLFAVCDEEKGVSIRTYLRKAWHSLFTYILILSAIGVIPFSGWFVIFLGNLLVKAIILPIQFHNYWDLFCMLAAIAWFFHAIVLFTQYLLAPYILVQERLGLRNTLKKSAQYGHGSILRILLHTVIIGLSLSIINIIPFLGPIVNIIVAVPVSTIYMYLVYKRIRLHHVHM